MADTLEFWDPQADAKVKDDHFDWKVVAPGSSADKRFRVRNSSAEYTAVGVQVTLEHLGIYDPALPVSVQHFLSVNGRLFTASVNVGTLAPRAISAPIILRRVTAPIADEGSGEFQLSAHATDWN